MKEKEAVSAVSAGLKSEPFLIIDPGHGGEDGGAVAASGLRESEVNLDISLRLRALCELFGVEVCMTRESETLPYPVSARSTAERKRWDTRRRVEMIHSVPNGVLLSIHQNFYPSAEPFGPQAFYGCAAGSVIMAKPFHETLSSVLCQGKRRALAPVPDGVYVLEHADCPAVLAECGFLSNPAEAALLATPRYRLKTAAALLVSYLSYREEINEK